jgi:hypothetical protein
MLTRPTRESRLAIPSETDAAPTQVHAHNRPADHQIPTRSQGTSEATRTAIVAPTGRRHRVEAPNLRSTLAGPGGAWSASPCSSIRGGPSQP